MREDTLLVKKVKKEKTTFAKHHFFLFNDILLDTVKNREGKFKLAQVYSLSETSFMKYEGETGNVLRGVGNDTCVHSHSSHHCSPADTVALFHTSSPESAEEDLAKAIHVKADQGGDIDGWLRDALDAKSSRTFLFHFASLSWAAILTRLSCDRCSQCGRKQAKLEDTM